MVCKSYGLHWERESKACLETAGRACLVQYTAGIEMKVTYINARL